MNEKEWLECTDLEQMLQFLRKDWKHYLFELCHWIGLSKHNGKERKLRLFSCACIRSVWDKVIRRATQDCGRSRRAICRRRGY